LVATKLTRDKTQRKRQEKMPATKKISKKRKEHQRKNGSNNGRWEVYLARLAAYKAAHGDCNVPQG
jgi:hypothetical protein